MSVGSNTARPYVWMEGLGDWRWPGRGSVAVEVLPPSWVPAFPPRSERVAPAGGRGAAPWRTRRALARPLTGALLSGMAALSAALMLTGPGRVIELPGTRI